MQVICCTSKLPSAQGIPLAWTRFKLLEKEQRDLKLGFLHPKSLFCFWFCVLFPFILVCWLLNIFVLHTGHRLLKVCGFLLSLGNSQTSFSKWSEFFPSLLCLADFNCHTAVLQPHVQLKSKTRALVRRCWLPLPPSASSQSISGIICPLACQAANPWNCLELCLFALLALSLCFQALRKRAPEMGFFGSWRQKNASQISCSLCSGSVGHEEPSVVDGAGSWADLQ